MRINRFLAACGLGSRRSCEKIVLDGRVRVNDKPCESLATTVAPTDIVQVDGRSVTPDEPLVVLFNKPGDCVCTRHDPEGRRTIYDVLPAGFKSLHYAGRLDRDSQGLLILTNSGEVSEKLSHPRHKIEKEYLVTLDKAFSPPHELKRKLLEGLPTPEGRASAHAVRQISPRRVLVTLQQGMKRQIRHMFAALGYRVQRLERVRIGSLAAPDLRQGKWRTLGSREIALLFRLPPRPKR